MKEDFFLALFMKNNASPLGIKGRPLTVHLIFLNLDEEYLQNILLEFFKEITTFVRLLYSSIHISTYPAFMSRIQSQC